MASSAVDTHHPLYDEIFPDWEIVRDFSEGQRKVKSRGQRYLPATSGMRQKGMTKSTSEGTLLYQAYVTRAVVPELVKPAVNALVGVMHREDAEIQLPEAMEPLRENATLEGESLLTLLRRINCEQVETGRIGLLVDVPVNGDANALPYIVTYDAENIINWDCSRRPDGRERPDFIVLDESAFERTDRFTWERRNKYLVLDLASPDAEVAQPDSEGTGQGLTEPDDKTMYRSQLVIQDSVQSSVVAEGTNRQTEVTTQDSPQAFVFPSIRGTTLEEIPFVFIGSVDLTVKPDQIPMLPLANLCHAIYLGEADYRQTLFQQGQATFIVIGDQAAAPGADSGEGKTYIVGASASINLPPGADAKYVGVPAEGISEQRQAIENDRGRASELGANILSNARGGSGGGGREAAETLKIRVAARTATLMSVVTAGAEGLQTSLRQIATWMGLDPEEVIVTPNTDFVEDAVPTSDLVDLTSAKSQGAPISLKTIHGYMKSKDLTIMTFEEEMAEIESEEPMNPPPRSGDTPTFETEEERLRREEEEEAEAAQREAENSPSGTEDDPNDG